MPPQDQLPSIQNELEPWLRSFDHIADVKQFSEISHRISSLVEKRFSGARCRMAISQAGTMIQAYIISKDGKKKLIEWALKPASEASIRNMLINDLCHIFLGLRIKSKYRKRRGETRTTKRHIYKFFSFLDQGTDLKPKTIVRRMKKLLSGIRKDEKNLFLEFAKEVSKDYYSLSPGQVFYENDDTYTFMAIIDYKERKVILPYWEDETRKQIVMTMEEMAKEVIERRLYWVYCGQVPYPE